MSRPLEISITIDGGGQRKWLTIREDRLARGGWMIRPENGGAMFGGTLQSCLDEVTAAIVEGREVGA